MEADDEDVVASVVVLHLQNDDVGKENAVHVDVVASRPEGEALSIVDRTLLRSPEANEEDHGGLGIRIEEPNPELLHIEDGVAHANAIVDWSVHEHFYLEFPVKQSIPNVVETGESNVVDLVDPLLVHGLSREDGPVSEQELNHDIEDVLVEHEENEFAISSVSLTTVDEE